MRALVAILLAAACAACATSAGNPAERVAVYEARPSVPARAQPLPDGCRSLGALSAVRLADVERYADDPYRAQRRETEARGGNVLLAMAETLVNRPNTNCPSSDRSADCLRGGNSWYRVSFESFTCSPEAREKLASTLPETSGGPLTWKLSPTRTSVAELKAKLIAMKDANVSPDVMVAYVRRRRLRKPLAANDIIEWKRAGIPDAVIEAAVSR